MKLHVRKRRIARMQAAASPYDRMMESDLLKAGKAAGFPAGGAGWPLETLIRKLKEQTNGN